MISVYVCKLVGTLCFEGFGCRCCVKSEKAPIGVNKINRTNVEGVLALDRWDENGVGVVCFSCVSMLVCGDGSEG